MITTLDDIRNYFAWLGTQPLPQGPHECEAVLLPLLEAFRDWDAEVIAELFVQLGLTLCVMRGEEGRRVLAEAYLQIHDKLIQRGFRAAAGSMA